MKPFITLLSAILFLFNIAGAQYFQGSAAKDPSDVNNMKIAFKMKPTGNITTGISYIEAAFRYATAGIPALVITNITSNTATFPGLAIQRFTPDYVAGGYTYVKFVFNTATIQTAQYTAGTEYQLFTITTSLPASAAPNFEMISNLALGQYQFGVVDGAGNLLDPGAGAQLYGPGFTITGNDHILRISGTQGPLPVKFSNFSVGKSDNNSLLTWTVENQDAGTSYFDIERSWNGSDFTRIGTVRANPATGTHATYTFTDVNARINASAHFIYYRIKQVDIDNKFVYTGIRNIVINNSMDASLYPNPASKSTLLSFYCSAPDNISIHIINLEGKKLRTVEFSGTSGLNQKRIDIADLPAGMYNVVLHGGGYVKTLQFIKVK